MQKIGRFVVKQRLGAVHRVIGRSLGPEVTLELPHRAIHRDPFSRPNRLDLACLGETLTIQSGDPSPVAARPR